MKRLRHVVQVQALYVTQAPTVQRPLAAQTAVATRRAQNTATGLPAAMAVVADPAQQAQQQRKLSGRQMQMQMQTRRVLRIQHENPVQQAHQRKQVRKQRQQRWQPWMRPCA